MKDRVSARTTMYEYNGGQRYNCEIKFYLSNQRIPKFNPVFYILPLAHECRQQLKKKKKSHNPQATGQNKSENCGPTTRRIDSAAVDRIKGIPIHPPEGSCSGYPLIHYSAASDACSRRCVNPAAK
jgi:hypothetical protein